MSIPQVSIVGRPNVGKSSLFNWLAGRRLAIVDNMAGVTRDRMTYLLQEDSRYFEIIDTGGIGINDIDDLDDLRMLEQEIVATKKCDPLDQRLLEAIQRFGVVADE